MLIRMILFMKLVILIIFIGHSAIAGATFISTIEFVVIILLLITIFIFLFLLISADLYFR